MSNPSGAPRAQAVDKYVGARLRERRIMLGLTQQDMAALIGVTYQQAHKYEKGINRIAAGRLYHIAQALGVDINYFFEGVGTVTPTPDPKQRMLLELARNFLAVPGTQEQQAIMELTRALAEAAGAGRDE